ncbi:MAG: pilus assembly protein [Elusimicrobia bacterium]|nr:pilus assembly protein [Elusimicrobiota bacterium]
MKIKSDSGLRPAACGLRRRYGLWRQGRRGRKGQTTVELLLVLPIFVLMLCLCMELGNIAHQVIMVHHCAYELARIGSLVAGPKGGSPDNTMSDVPKALARMRAALQEMFPSYYGKINLSAVAETTQIDPQAAGHQNEDLVVVLKYPVELLFPVSNYVLADPPNKQAHIMSITVRMRMPIEKPMFR